jgi:hypothetical protein
LVDLGRPEEAATYASAARDVAGEADVLSQVLWRSAMARALVEQGVAEEPVELVHEAVRLAGSTEWPNVIADSLLDRARVLHGLGRASDPAAERADIERASVVYLAKGNEAGRAKAIALATVTRPHGHVTRGRGGRR